MRTWLEVECAHCGATNFVDNGDPGDMTAFDTGGFSCWKCQTNNEFDGDDVVLSQEDQLEEGRQRLPVTD